MECGTEYLSLVCEKSERPRGRTDFKEVQELLLIAFGPAVNVV